MHDSALDSRSAIRLGCGRRVVGLTLIRAMHFSLCAYHLVQRTLMRLDDRAQPILVSFFHDGGRISVFVVCGDGYVAPPRPCFVARRCDSIENVTRAFLLHLGATRDFRGSGEGGYWTRRRGPMSVSAAVSISEGGERSDSAKRAMLPTVRCYGSMHTWWRRIRYTGVCGGGPGKEPCTPSCRPIGPVSTHVTDDHAASASLSDALRTHLCLSSGRFFRCRAIRTGTVRRRRRRMRTSRVWLPCARRASTTSVSDDCWLVSGVSEPRNGNRWRR